MQSTSFTGDEWHEFLDGFDDPEDAYAVADRIWNREREAKLKEYQEFIEHCQASPTEQAEANDLLTSAWSLYTGNTNIYREVMDRLTKWVYDHGYEPIVYESDSLPGT